MKYVDDELRDIRSAIRAGCAYTGVTQAELAAFMGISPETMSRKMNNKGHFTDDELAIAQEVVGIRPETMSRKMNNKGHFTDDELAIAQEVVLYLVQSIFERRRQ